MKKKLRQYGCLLVGILIYYLVHEGAHLVYALSIGTFKQINILSLGIQIEIYDYLMSNLELGIFCLVGVLASLCVGYILLFIQSTSGIHYYTTLVLLLLDPLYLSVVYPFVGGGDMNGIKLLVLESDARLVFLGLFVLNSYLFYKINIDKLKTDHKGEKVG